MLNSLEPNTVEQFGGHDTRGGMESIRIFPIPQHMDTWRCEGSWRDSMKSAAGPGGELREGPMETHSLYLIVSGFPVATPHDDLFQTTLPTTFSDMF